MWETDKVTSYGRLHISIDPIILSLDARGELIGQSELSKDNQVGETGFGKPDLCRNL
jgi:hypothetical protein